MSLQESKARTGQQLVLILCDGTRDLDQVSLDDAAAQHDLTPISLLRSDFATCPVTFTRENLAPRDPAATAASVHAAIGGDGRDTDSETIACLRLQGTRSNAYGHSLASSSKVVSRWHAMLEWSPNGRLTIKDLGSTHGTFVARSSAQLHRSPPVSRRCRPEEPVEIHDGDVITLGKAVLKNDSLHRPLKCLVKILNENETWTPRKDAEGNHRYACINDDAESDDGDHDGVIVEDVRSPSMDAHHPHSSPVLARLPSIEAIVAPSNSNRTVIQISDGEEEDDDDDDDSDYVEEDGDTRQTNIQVQDVYIMCEDDSSSDDENRASPQPIELSSSISVRESSSARPAEAVAVSATDGIVVADGAIAAEEEAYVEEENVEEVQEHQRSFLSSMHPSEEAGEEDEDDDMYDEDANDFDDRDDMLDEEDNNPEEEAAHEDSLAAFETGKEGASLFDFLDEADEMLRQERPNSCDGVSSSSSSSSSRDSSCVPHEEEAKMLESAFTTPAKSPMKKAVGAGKSLAVDRDGTVDNLKCLDDRLVGSSTAIKFDLHHSRDYSSIQDVNEARLDAPAAPASSASASPSTSSRRKRTIDEVDDDTDTGACACMQTATELAGSSSGSGTVSSSKAKEPPLSPRPAKRGNTIAFGALCAAFGVVTGAVGTIVGLSQFALD